MIYRSVFFVPPKLALKFFKFTKYKFKFASWMSNLTNEINQKAHNALRNAHAIHVTVGSVKQFFIRYEIILSRVCSRQYMCTSLFGRESHFCKSLSELSVNLRTYNSIEFTYRSSPGRTTNHPVSLGHFWWATYVRYTHTNSDPGPAADDPSPGGRSDALFITGYCGADTAAWGYNRRFIIVHLIVTYRMSALEIPTTSMYHICYYICYARTSI